MKIRLFLLAACAALAFQSCATHKSVELFNGTDLTGWQGWLADSTLNVNEEFTVVDGVINLSGKFGYLYTEAQYSDYILEFEWRYVGEATNSGVFLHMQPGNKQWPTSFEFQLMDTNAGDIIHSGGTSSAELEANPSNRVLRKINPSNERPVGEWNSGRAICEGDEITVFVNGLEQNRLTGISHSSGSIGLQSEGKTVQFRNLKLTSLKK